MDARIPAEPRHLPLGKALDGAGKRLQHVLLRGKLPQQVLADEAVFQPQTIQKIRRYACLEQAVHLFEHALLDTARQALVNARAQRGTIPGDAQAQHVVARALLRGQGIAVVQLFQRAHHAVAVLGIDGIAGRGGLQHGAELRGGQPFQLAAIG